MCFPTKSQKNNFADDAAPKSSKKPTEKSKAPDTKAATPAASTTPAANATSTPSDPSATAQIHEKAVTSDTVTVADAPAEAPQASTSSQMASPRVAIVIYSLFHHIAKMGEAIKEGIVEAGGNATIYQIDETLPEAILKIIHAPARPDYPILKPDDLVNFDAFIFGIPTRYGNMPSQWKNFFDSTGPLWAASTLSGKYAGLFVSTGSQGGGQEVTLLNMQSTLAHHGILYVPLGYKYTFAELTNNEEVHGGTPWGAGTYAGSDHARQPSKLELHIARKQGEMFWKTVARVDWSVSI